MVLPGAEFQRSGPVGCTLLTRRALLSDTAMFLQGRSNAAFLQHGNRIAHRRLMRFHGVDQCRHFTKDSRHMARECDVCHGDIGEL